MMLTLAIADIMLGRGEYNITLGEQEMLIILMHVIYLCLFVERSKRRLTYYLPEFLSGIFRNSTYLGPYTCNV